MKILIVEEDRSTRRKIQRHLSRLGYTTEEATNGKACLDQLNSLNVNVILLSWNMSSLSGPDTLKEIKSNSKFNEIKIIALTDQNKKEQIQESKNAGADAILEKPLTKENIQSQFKALNLITEQSESSSDNNTQTTYQEMTPLKKAIHIYWMILPILFLAYCCLVIANSGSELIIAKNTPLNLDKHYNPDKSYFSNVIAGKHLFLPRDTCIDQKAKYESRKKMRWLYASASRTIFAMVKHYNDRNTMIYFTSVYHGILFMLTFFFIYKSIVFLLKLENDIRSRRFVCVSAMVIFIFLLKLTHHNIAQEWYTPMETLCIAAASYYSLRHKFYPFLAFVLLGASCRETGILLSFLWLSANGIKNWKSYIPLAVSGSTLFLINYDISHCFMKKEFLFPTSDQDFSFFSFFMGIRHEQFTGNFKLFYGVMNLFLTFALFAFPLLFLPLRKKLFGVYFILAIYTLALFKGSPVNVPQPFMVMGPGSIVLLFSLLAKPETADGSVS